MLRNNRETIIILVLYLIFLSIENLLMKVVDINLLRAINICSIVMIFVTFTIYRCNELKYSLILRNYEVLFVIYLVLCVFTGYFTQSAFSDIFNSMLYETRYIFLFIVLRLLCVERDDYLFFIRGCVYWGLVQILLGFLQYYGTEDIRTIFLDTKYMSESVKLYEHVQESHRMVGTFLNKNIFSIYMLFNYVCLITMRDLFRAKIVKYSLILLHLTAIIMSGSRTVWFIVLLFFVKGVRWNRKIILSSLAVFVCFVTIIASTFEIRYSTQDKSTLLYKATEIFSPEYYDIVSSFGRLAYIFATFEILKDHPIVGLGAGNWGTGIAYKDSQDYEHITYGNYSIPKGVMHDNNYASIIGQFGLITLITFVSMLYFIMNSYKLEPMVALDSLNLVHAMFICMLLMSFTWTPFASKPISLYFWALLGLTNIRNSQGMS